MIGILGDGWHFNYVVSLSSFSSSIFPCARVEEMREIIHTLHWDVINNNIV
jgi:hypothetical protein